jgi:hypothetical protein
MLDFEKVAKRLRFILHFFYCKQLFSILLAIADPDCSMASEAYLKAAQRIRRKNTGTGKQ